MSQHDLIIRQLQEQLAVAQAQIQALIEGGAVVRRARRGDRTISIKVARLQVFDRTSSKVSEFVMACKLYIKMKIRKVVVKE